VGEMLCWGGGGREEGEGGGGGGARGAGGGAHVRACVRAFTRRLTCPLLPNVNYISGCSDQVASQPQRILRKLVTR
jgi:hypothetical protein